MKVVVDKKRSEKEFEEGGWIAQKIGVVAYILLLPKESRVHPIFHVSRLKEFKGTLPVKAMELPEDPLPFVQ
ncbi:reverse transcriptase [Senna tora]|uniref:Reverse transcriptase n=1 Tax=Senna tora TaxID=362788 RepID=A0A834T796_9FABA|nr:reverse transcriptase [Senna tora]